MPPSVLERHGQRSQHSVKGASLAAGVGVVATFGLFYIAERVLHLDRKVVQSLMYLKLSVAGHLNIFVTRTRGPFWSIMPARILLIAVFGTQAVATIIAVYGLLMPAIGWELGLMVWGYAIVWFFINDGVKLLGYRIFDRPDEPALLKTRGPAAAASSA
jgi:H+-transporting ATPase